MKENYLRTFLFANKITQTEIAEAINVKPGYINRKLNGKIKWNLDECFQIAEYISHKLGRHYSIEEIFLPGCYQQVKCK